jgi:hypothetical protein
MQKQWKLVLTLLSAAGLFWSALSTAQDDKVPVAPVELFGCSFKEGKGMSDLEKVNAKFAKWSKKQDPGYSAWVMSPQFAMQSPFEVLWLGSWQTGGKAMGQGLDNWQAGNDGIADDYWDVIECGHVLMSSVAINAANGPPDNGVAMFSRCSVADGKTSADAFQAHVAFSKAMREMGGKGQSWLMYPALGLASADFDYLAVTTFNNYAELGEAWSLYSNGDGWKKAGEIMGGVATCKSPNVWDAKLVVGNER